MAEAVPSQPDLLNERITDMRFYTSAALTAALLLPLGCSKTTKEEAKEALDATGEAVQAAAADAKVNAEKVGEAVKAGVERGREEFNEPDAPSVDGDPPPAEYERADP